MLAKEYNAAHVVGLERLRPGWTHGDSGWTFELGSARRPIDVWREVIGSGPPPSTDPPPGDCGSDFAASPGGAGEEEPAPAPDTEEERFAGFKWGMAVEVQGDQGLKGSWSPGEVMKARRPVQWAVAHPSCSLLTCSRRIPYHE